jgi:glutaredoxin 3
VLLEARGIRYQEQDVGRDQQLLAEMVQRTGSRTFPQIVINDRPIGGYTELAELDRTQQLDSLIYP